MPVHFTKMQGLGNDFIVVDLFCQTVMEPGALAVALCDRRLGVGADGLILAGPPGDPHAHLRIQIFNADGSRAETCGNGLRCVALLARERGWAASDPIAIETDAGLRTARSVPGRAGTEIQVDMGQPILEPASIPVNHQGERAIALAIEGSGLVGTCVSLGNPHLVLFLEEIEAHTLAVWGPRLARHALFPRGTNVHFARVLAPDRIQAVSWERGVGATPACGSGACAVCVAGVLEGRTRRAVTIQLPGGALEIEWAEPTNRLAMTGPAQEICRGTYLPIFDRAPARSVVDEATSLEPP